MSKKKAVIGILAVTGLLAALRWLQVHINRHAQIDKNLIQAIKGNDAIAVAALLDHGADANSVDGINADSNYPKWVQYILKHVFGYNVPASHVIQTPALLLATESGNITITKLLLDHGANVNAIDIHRQTALMWAVSWDNFDIVDMLLAHRADPNASDGYRSVLQHGINTPKIVRRLRQAGAYR